MPSSKSFVSELFFNVNQYLYVKSQMLGGTTRSQQPVQTPAACRGSCRASRRNLWWQRQCVQHHTLAACGIPYCHLPRKSLLAQSHLPCTQITAPSLPYASKYYCRPRTSNWIHCSCTPHHAQCSQHYIIHNKYQFTDVGQAGWWHKKLKQMLRKHQ